MLAAFLCSSVALNHGAALHYGPRRAPVMRLQPAEQANLDAAKADWMRKLAVVEEEASSFGVEVNVKRPSRNAAELADAAIDGFFNLIDEFEAETRSRASSLLEGVALPTVQLPSFKALQQECGSGNDAACEMLSDEEEAKAAWLARLDAPAWGSLASASVEVGAIRSDFAAAMAVLEDRCNAGIDAACEVLSVEQRAKAQWSTRGGLDGRPQEARRAEPETQRRAERMTALSTTTDAMVAKLPLSGPPTAVRVACITLLGASLGGLLPAAKAARLALALAACLVLSRGLRALNRHAHAAAVQGAPLVPVAAGAVPVPEGKALRAPPLFEDGWMARLDEWADAPKTVLPSRKRRLGRTALSLVVAFAGGAVFGIRLI